MFLHNRAADARCAGGFGEEREAGQKLLAILLGATVAGVTILLAVMPFALL